jgi:hypothetical protein
LSRAFALFVGVIKTGVTRSRQSTAPRCDAKRGTAARKIIITSKTAPFGPKLGL